MRVAPPDLRIFPPQASQASASSSLELEKGNNTISRKKGKDKLILKINKKIFDGRYAPAVGKEVGLELKLEGGRTNDGRDAGGAGEIEFGEEILDLASLQDPPVVSLESILGVSCFGAHWNCLVIPYKTSATSISISSWIEDGDLDPFSGRCLDPLIDF